MDKVFATVEVRAAKAYGITTKAAQKAASATAKAAQKAADDEGKAAEKASRKVASEAEKAASKAQAAAKKLSDGFAKSFSTIASVAEREMARVDKASSRASARTLDRFATRTSHLTARFLTPYAPLASIARRTAGDIARGAGVDFNVGSAVGRNVDRESLATALSSSGYQENTAGPNGQRVDRNTLRKEATDIGMKTGTDPTAILEAQRGFVGITGNLDQARKGALDLGKIAKATSSDVTDVFKAAAKINAQLEETPDKAEKTLAIVRLLAGQGKLGAAEMDDYAKSIGVIAGNAARFKGDVTKNIAQLSAMAQQSVQSGTSKSPVQAATAIASFANTFTKGARMKEFNKLGINTDASPQQIIEQSLVKTGGDKMAMAKLFADTRAHAAVLPYEKIFNQATGGKKDEASLVAGGKAVEAAFKRLTDGAMSVDEVNKEFAAQMDTTKSKAEIFQIKLDEIVDKVQSKVLPAFEKMEPTILKIVDGLGKLAEWIPDHVGEALALAVGYAVARAGLESVLRVGIESAIKGLAGNAGPAAAGVGEVLGGTGVGAGAFLGGGAAMWLGGAAAVGAAAYGGAKIGGLDQLDDMTKNSGGFMQNLSDAWNGKMARPSSGADYDRVTAGAQQAAAVDPVAVETLKVSEDHKKSTDKTNDLLIRINNTIVKQGFQPLPGRVGQL